ncbi:TonB-dependent receptor [Verticiella sediminum]|uniref:TonB-dependent receptor n=1 Tax=Verticiella sediminum TaxID=1247510 RepID=A0A556A815_9BURK|nr:TonB-dependent receptor [Verticiella sediminum]TSH89020.1 TonB-dependent receptor [Verticiella sediminum]
MPLKTIRRSTLVALASLGADALAAEDTPTATLETIVVSATGFEQDIRQAPASISVITREELESKPVHSLAEALADVEGVDIGDSAGKTGGLNISIRGMPSEYTLVLIDGRRQNVAGNVTPNGFGETSTSFLPPMSAIERIEVIRGPMSTLYGSDAMGGVVNIITRRVGREWHGSATIEGTLQQEKAFGNTAGGNVYLSGPLKQDLLGLTLRAGVFRRSAADVVYETPTTPDGETRPTMGQNPVEYLNRSVGARLALTPNRNHDILFDVDDQRQRYDNDAGQLGTLDSGTRIGGYEPRQRYNRTQYALSHTGRFGFGTLESSLMQNNTETIGRTIPNGTPGKEPGSPRDLEMRQTVFDTRLVTPISAGWGEHLLTLGGQWQKGKMVDGVAADPFEFKQWALFVENEWSIVPSFTLTGGVRYDHHDTFGGHTSPRLYAVWDATPNWTVKGGVSRGYKTPRLDQLASGIVGFGAQGTLPLVGSPNLKPETSTSTEVGVGYDNLAGFTANATVFNNEFRDKIASGPGLENCSWAGQPNRDGCVDYGYWPSVDLFGQSINVDKAVTRGVELGTRVPLNRAWSVRANYTYTDSEQKSGAEKGLPLTNTPKHMFNASLNWQPNDTWSAWLRAEMRSKRYRSAGVARDALGDYRSYALFHLGGQYRLNRNVSFNAAIYNLFNKNFVDYAPYTAANGSTSYTNRYVNNLEGRRLWLSANIQF